MTKPEIIVNGNTIMVVMALSDVRKEEVKVYLRDDGHLTVKRGKRIVEMDSLGIVKLRSAKLVNGTLTFDNIDDKVKLIGLTYGLKFWKPG